MLLQKPAEPDFTAEEWMTGSMLLFIICAFDCL
jgi:hypothetical protein